MFTQINHLATKSFEEYFGKYEEQFSDLNVHCKTSLKSIRSLRYQNRLHSSIINNRAVLMYFNISSTTSRKVRNIYYKRIQNLFELALQKSSENTVALLNKILFDWHIGALKDEMLLL